MRRLLVASLVLATAGAPTPAAAADDEPGSITATTNFVLGAVSVGAVHGFLAPGGHFDVGFRVRRWRLAAEAQTGLWTTPAAPGEPSVSGSFRRVGMALRWTWKELVIERGARRPAARFRGYVEAGLGREHARMPGVSIARGDVMLGFGVAPEVHLGRVLFGATFGIRALISRAPDDEVIARGTCAACTPSGRDGGHDLALLYTMGFTFGR